MQTTEWKSPWHRVLVGLGLFLLTAAIGLLVTWMFDFLRDPYMLGFVFGYACVFGVIPVSPRSFGRPASRVLAIVGAIAFIVLLVLGQANTNPAAGLALGLGMAGLMYVISYRKEAKSNGDEKTVTLTPG